MTYHQSAYTNENIIENQFLNSCFSLMGIQINKKAPFPKGFITGNKAINEDENIIKRLLKDMIHIFLILQ